MNDIINFTVKFLKKIKPSYWIIILMALIILYMKQCPSCPPCKDNIIYKDTIIIKRDTIRPKPEFIDLTTEVPEPEEIPIFIPMTLTKEDSQKIMLDYYIARQYDSVYTKKDTVSVSFHGLVCMNKLKEFKLKAVPLTPQIKETITIEKTLPPKNKVFVGFNLNTDYKLSTLGAGPSIALCTKKDNLYNISSDLINKYVSFNIYWKIKFNKNK